MYVEEPYLHKELWSPCKDCVLTFLCSPRQVSVDLQKAERTEHQTEEIACSTYLPSYKSSAFLPMVRVIRLTNHNMKG